MPQSDRLAMYDKLFLMTIRTFARRLFLSALQTLDQEMLLES